MAITPNHVIPLARSKKSAEDYSPEKRWGKSLAKPFAPISSFFLAHYHELAPHTGAQGLSSTEAMLIIHLFDFKWGVDAPFPSLGRLAKRMGLSVRQVRATIKQMEDLGFIKRIPRPDGGSNRIELTGLLKALEQLQEKVADEADKAQDPQEVRA